MNGDTVSRSEKDGARVFLLMDSYPSDYQILALHPSTSAIFPSVVNWADRRNAFDQAPSSNVYYLRGRRRTGDTLTSLQDRENSKGVNWS